MNPATALGAIGIHTVLQCFLDVTGDCGEGGCLYYNENPLGWAPSGIGRMLVFLTLQVRNVYH